MEEKVIKPINKNTLPEINSYFSQVIGKAPWNVFSGTGAVFAMDFGRMKHDQEKKHFISEYHIFVTNTNWQITNKNKIHVESSSSRLEILEKSGLAEGKILESIDIDFYQCDYILRFGHEITINIHIDPESTLEDYKEAVTPDWMLFLPSGKAIGFGPGLFFDVECSRPF